MTNKVQNDFGRRYKKSISIIGGMKFRVVISEDEDGQFIAECPVLPGCISQGKTREAAIKNIKDAISGYVKSLKKHNEPIPPPISEEMVEISV